MICPGAVQNVCCVVEVTVKRRVASVCKRQCFFTANLRAMAIKDKNDMPTKNNAFENVENRGIEL
jgi:hypothetical protein